MRGARSPELLDPNPKVDTGWGDHLGKPEDTPAIDHLGE